MIYFSTFSIKINHSWIGKYTGLVPWIRNGKELCDNIQQNSPSTGSERSQLHAARKRRFACSFFFFGGGGLGGVVLGCFESHFRSLGNYITNHALGPCFFFLGGGGGFWAWCVDFRCIYIYIHLYLILSYYCCYYDDIIIRLHIQWKIYVKSF